MSETCCCCCCYLPRGCTTKKTRRRGQPVPRTAPSCTQPVVRVRSAYPRTALFIIVDYATVTMAACRRKLEYAGLAALLRPTPILPLFSHSTERDPRFSNSNQLSKQSYTTVAFKIVYSWIHGHQDLPE